MEARDALLTFVLKKVTHASASGENELCDVFDDLCLDLGGHSRVPFCKSNLAFWDYPRCFVSSSEPSILVRPAYLVEILGERS